MIEIFHQSKLEIATRSSYFYFILWQAEILIITILVIIILYYPNNPQLH